MVTLRYLEGDLVLLQKLLPFISWACPFSLHLTYPWPCFYVPTFYLGPPQFLYNLCPNRSFSNWWQCAQECPSTHTHIFLEKIIFWENNIWFLVVFKLICDQTVYFMMKNTVLLWSHFSKHSHTKNLTHAFTLINIFVKITFVVGRFH